MENTMYKLLCRKKTEQEKWIVKAICPEKWKIEKFKLNLETCSNVYQEIKIETMTEAEGK